MSDLFSASTFFSQKALRERGIDVQRSWFPEIFASFFGYQHSGEMHQEQDELDEAIASQPLVVLQSQAAFFRMTDLLRGQVRADQMQPVYEIVKTNLLHALPPTTFNDEDHLLKTYIADEVKQWLLHASNPEVVNAQAAVSNYCSVFRPDDLDFPNVIDVQDAVWFGHFTAMLYHALPDGQPAYLEDQITTTTFVRAAKLGRVLLSRDLLMSTVVTAFKPHGGTGGTPLYP